MKKLFRKAYVNAKNSNQITVQFQTIEQGVVPSASLAAQGFTGEETRTVLQSFKKEVFEAQFPGYTPGATSEAAVVVNVEYPTYFGADWKIQHKYTTDSAKAQLEYFQEVKNSSTGAVMTSNGAVVYRKSILTLDMGLLDDPKPVYDSSTATVN